MIGFYRRSPLRLPMTDKSRREPISFAKNGYQMKRTPISFAKNRDQMKKLEEIDDCFILEFDPSLSTGSDEAGSTYCSVNTRPISRATNRDKLKNSKKFHPSDEIEISKLSISSGCNEAVSTDLSVDARPILCARSRNQMKKLEKEEDCIILEFDPYDEIEMSKLSLSDDEVGCGDLSLVLCAKNREQMKKLEKREDCFILQFDPCDEVVPAKLSVSKCSIEASSADLCVVAEKGQVACRDYPHSRNNCATHPFEKTPHDCYCKLCFCYVCDTDAPCPMWLGSSGHCHAFNNEMWNEKRKERKLKVASGDYPHYRHNCAIYAFNNVPHDNHCKKCYCYVCDTAAPCQKWGGSSGHCHAFNSETWDRKKEERKSNVSVQEKQGDCGENYVSKNIGSKIIFHY